MPSAIFKVVPYEQWLQMPEVSPSNTQIADSGQLRPLRFPESLVDVASVWPD